MVLDINTEASGFDSRTSTGPVVTSDGDEATLHVDPLARVVYSQVSATAPTGTV